MISILSKAATWFREQPFGEAFSCVFSSPPCSPQLIWTAVIFDGAGVPVSIVWRRLRGGEDVRTLARDYGITEEDVQEAVQFHEKAA